MVKISGPAQPPPPPTGMSSSYKWHYEYENLSRLASACSVWDAGTSTCLGDSFTYSYDGAGNLLAFSRWDEAGAQVETVRFVHNGANQIACLDGGGDGVCGDPDDVAYSYDAYGNLTSDAVRTYAYDAENRLISISDGVSTTSYNYNGDGDRVLQSVDGVTTSYVIDIATPLTMVLAETTGTETIYYLHGLDLVAQQDGTSTEYFGYDGLGSVRQMLDGSGAVLFAQVFDPYGNPYASAGTDSTSWGFIGEQTDANGLIFLRTRYYDTRQGRFFTRDPFSGSVDYPATLNPYLYGLNNPILHVDPSGENPLLVALLPPLIGAAAGFVTGATAGGIYGYATYEWALTGECGCDIKQQALSMTKWEWAGAHALSGGIIGGVAGGIAAAAPIGMIVVGGTGVIVSGVDFINTVQIMKNETGITACTVTRLIMDVAGAVFSGIGIRKGVNAWRESGSPLRWTYNPAPVPRNPLDIAAERDNPIPPPANRGNSTISSSPTQNADAQNWVQQLYNIRAEDIRANQEQVNGAGIRVGINKPDLQFTYRGQRYYVEWDDPGSTRGIPHAQRIQANDPAATDVFQLTFPYSMPNLRNLTYHIILITMK